MEIITTHFTRLPKILIYGMQGIGKSSFAASMPRPIFIQTTDGLEGLGVQAFPLAKTAEDVRKQLTWLLTNPHNFKTVVIDTIGWLEKLIHAEVLAQTGYSVMTQASMKTYPMATQKLMDIKALLDAINIKRKMFVCILGHASIQKFEDPTAASYDRYALDMNEKAGNIFLQDADIVGFYTQKVHVKTEEHGFGKEVVKAQGQSRYLYFDQRPAFFAKQHDYGLPDEIEDIEKGAGWKAMWAFMKEKFAQAKPRKDEEQKEEDDLNAAAAKSLGVPKSESIIHSSPKNGEAPKIEREESQEEMAPVAKKTRATVSGTTRVLHETASVQASDDSGGFTDSSDNPEEEDPEMAQVHQKQARRRAQKKQAVEQQETVTE